MNDQQRRDQLSAQSACDCGARPGKLHSSDCQYVIDLQASVGDSTAATSQK